MLFERNEKKLLQGKIPKYERVKPGFISVLKAHSETNLTNLLAYLFSGKDYPQLQALFLPALIDCIDLDPEDDLFLNEMIETGLEDIKVIPEYRTKFGKIDILIVKQSDRQSEKSAIIVENKLYHELNNDFDDYFYSVIEDEGILAKNIAVVALSLKPFDHAFPSYMKSGKLTHKDLQGAVREALNENQSILNDRDASLFLNEYLLHIDDLYLDRSVYSNEKCFEFYSNNRKLINSIIGKTGDLNIEKFELNLADDKKILYELKHKIDQVQELQIAVSQHAEDSFNHYLKLTERAVQGKDYFRGRGLAFDAIRYNLDFQNHFVSDAPIELDIWINGLFLSQNGIDLNDDKFQTILRTLGVSLPLPTLADQWYRIHSETHEIDGSILMNILKDEIDGKWGRVEDLLSLYISNALVARFNQDAFSFLKQNSLGAKSIKNGTAIQFSSLMSEVFCQYSIKFSPPDLVEIVLYIENNYWDDVSQKISEKEKFTKFSLANSYRIPGLKQEQLGGNIINFDALFKKSYRIKSLDEIPALLESEKENWAQVEKEIVEVIVSGHEKKSPISRVSSKTKAAKARK